MRLASSVSTVVLVGLMSLAAATSPAQETGVKRQHRYESRYLVFGFRDQSRRPGIVAMDFNKTFLGGGQATYEYKGWLGHGTDWRMFLYKEWKAAEGPEAWPSMDGARIFLAGDGAMDVRVDQSAVKLSIRTEPPRFLFREAEESGLVETAHPRIELELAGERFAGRGVYEWVHSDPSRARENPAEAARRRRRLDEGSSFGLYDWIVLYDETGELWQVSQGTQTEAFGYHLDSDIKPRVTHEVLVLWLKTRPDATAKREAPEEWLVDVPAWNFRARLGRVGEHRGHGPPGRGGQRPVYAQIGVQGEGIIDGERRSFFGMIELIED